MITINNELFYLIISITVLLVLVLYWIILDQVLQSKKMDDLLPRVDQIETLQGNQVTINGNLYSLCKAMDSVLDHQKAFNNAILKELDNNKGKAMLSDLAVMNFVVDLLERKGILEETNDEERQQAILNIYQALVPEAKNVLSIKKFTDELTK